LAIGDAVGTGPEAAALTALVRHTLRALAMSEAGTERVLRSLNDALLGAASDSSESFCTVLFAVLSLVGDEVHLQIASGGHPYPILRHADGSTEELPLGGSLLGSFADVEVATLDVVLGAGDTMVFVTDGVLEAHREGAFFDVEGVHDVLSHSEADAASVATALERAVLRHCRGHLGDDMAALVLHVAG
jgi:sigma-B regulation protein RsbU (phosphoserine phosphatase)